MTRDTLLNTDAVVIPDAPALPGLVFRRFRGEEDYAGMTAVLQAANAADGIDDFISTEELTADFILMNDVRLEMDPFRRATDRFDPCWIILRGIFQEPDPIAGNQRRADCA